MKNKSCLINFLNIISLTYIFLIFPVWGSCPESLRALFSNGLHEILVDEVIYSTKRNEIVLKGRVDSREDSVNLAKIHFNFIDEKTISIDHVYVEEFARRAGLQNQLFKILLEKYPGVNRIKSFFDETNAIVFHRKMIQLLDPDHIIENDYTELSIGVEMTDCCLESFNVLSAKEQKKMVEQGIRETPAYRSRIRNGFELCPGELEYEFRSNSIFPGMKVILWACRK